jgi:FkbM family methyltransferase
MNALGTASKLRFARWLYRGLKIWRRLAGHASDEVICERRNVRWCLDLGEGVQLGLYLGTYERRTGRLLAALVNEGAIVLDIGANIGAHALPLAHRVGQTGRVIAIEPVAETFRRLRRNCELNGPLSRRMTLLQAALGERDSATQGRYYYGSWPLRRGGERHAVHAGLAQSTAGARFYTLDLLADMLQLPRVDLIKIDVDGDELPILRGAEQVLSRFAPTIVFEYCPYLLIERGAEPTELLRFLRDRGYGLHDEHRDEIDDLDILTARVPAAGSVNLIAERQKNGTSM